MLQYFAIFSNRISYPTSKRWYCTSSKGISFIFLLLFSNFRAPSTILVPFGRSCLVIAHEKRFSINTIPRSIEEAKLDSSIILNWSTDARGEQRIRSTMKWKARRQESIINCNLISIASPPMSLLGEHHANLNYLNNEFTRLLRLVLYSSQSKTYLMGFSCSNQRIILIKIHVIHRLEI